MNESNHGNDLPRMSIKDRIRAMNLDAGQRNTGHIKPFSSLPRTRFGERASNNIRVSADCDLSTLKTTRNMEKPSGLMSDPGVGCDSHRVAAAINMWRKRATEEKSKDKTQKLKEDNYKEDTKKAITDLSNHQKFDNDKDVRNEINNNIQNVFPLLRSPIHQSNEGAFVKSKLKPFRKAPHTLKLIQDICARRSLVGGENMDGGQAVRQAFNSSSTRHTKISDRIKVYNSAKNGNNWKPAVPPIHLGQMKRLQTTKHSNLYEDASIDSSERQSFDEDSTSHCTPRVSGNSARMTAQPPTPSSYVSDSVYTAASSGDGAVVGSVGSSQQLNPIENRYSAMSTPETSIAGNDDSSGTSSKQQQIYPMRPVKIQPQTSVRPHVKNSLQSKLEYDKARAIRRSMLVRKQKKPPSNAILTQKKDQDTRVKSIEGASLSVQSKNTDGRLEKFLSPSARSDLRSRTARVDVIQKNHAAKPVVMDAPDDEAASMNHIARSKAESPNECKSSEGSLRSKSNEKIPMKADAMKEIIRRRRRRKEFQAGKTDSCRESEKSPKVAVENIKNNWAESETHTSNNKPKDVVDDVNCVITDISKSSRQRKMPMLDVKINDKKDDISKLSPFARTPDVSLPPEIQRATEKGYSNMGAVESLDSGIKSIPTSSEGNPIGSSGQQQQGNLDAIEPSPTVHNSISVASSLIHDEDSSNYDEDEPEPVVDSFMIELSPIKAQDASKHIFDTSTMYQGSPSSYSSSQQQNPEFTPKRGSRNIAPTSSNGSLAHVSGSENKFEQSHEKVTSDQVSNDGVTAMPSSEVTELKHKKSKSSVNDAHSEASSGIRSVASAISTISSVFSTNSSRANKLLSERRSKTYTEDKTYAIDLARKIMHSFQNKPKPYSVEKDGVTASEAQMQNREDNPNKITDEATPHSSEDLKVESEVNHVSNDENLKLNDDIVEDHPQSADNSILIESTEISDSYETSRSFHTNNMSTSVETGSEPNCYKYSFLHMDKIPNLSEICGDVNKLELTNSLNTSAISAVRISQENDDDDIPFDEEVAIEVEYLTNEDMESLASRKKKTDEIMMRIPTTLDKYPVANIFISGAPNQGPESEYNAPNYVSESSCENETSGELSFSTTQPESQQV